MTCKEPLKTILIATRDYWDRIETRAAVRTNFESVIDCGTPELGAEVYGSDTTERLVYHTCKSKACPSCGHGATLQWQREQWDSLPDIPFAGVVFTMPSALWPIFQQNRHLLRDLPAVGAAVVRQWTKLKYGVSVLIMVIPHTFGGRLNFNSHLHILVSTGGLQEAEGRWVHGLDFDKKKLMHMWRFAVITFLRESLKAGVLTSDLSPDELRQVLANEFRWWSIHVDHFHSKTHFLQYAGRYVRRPPIAQYRFEKITDREVQFWVKDKKLKKRVSIQCSPREFVSMLGEHIPDRYRSLDSSLRFAGASFKGSILCGCVSFAGTATAAPSATIGLGVFVAKRLWHRSADRLQRPSDVLDRKAALSGPHFAARHLARRTILHPRNS